MDEDLALIDTFCGDREHLLNLFRTVSKDSNYHMEDVSSKMPYAIQLLEKSEKLQNIRFKLVPQKMKEEQFWPLFFQELENARKGERRERNFNNLHNIIEGEITNLQQQQADLESEKEEKEEKKEEDESEHLDLMKEFPQLLSQLKMARDEIQMLKQQLELAQQNHHAQHQGNGNGIPSLPAVARHQGVWEIDKRMQEFLNLDDSVKADLRKEKNKRMQQVVGELGWIADYDDITRLPGRWSCCGQTVYGIHNCPAAKK